MAESESAPKAMDLYLGVVDQFGTILPGALLTFAVTRLGGGTFGVPEDWPKEASQWAAFLVIAYVAGHGAHALGSLVLDPIYDHTYKLWKTKRYTAIRVRALEVVRVALGPFWMDGDNTLEWSTTFLRLHSGALSTAVDRLEADSKFFRSLTIVLVLVWPLFVLRRGPTPLCLTGAAIGLLPVIFFAVWLPLAGPHDRDLRRAKDINVAASSGAHGLLEDPMPNEFRKAVMARRKIAGTFAHEAQAETEANTALSRHPLRRTLVVALTWALLLVAWAVIESALAPRAEGINRFLFVGGVAAYAVLTVFAAWRFMEQRLKRTELTYRSVVALFALRPILGTPEGAEAQKE